MRVRTWRFTKLPSRSRVMFSPPLSVMGREGTSCTARRSSSPGRVRHSLTAYKHFSFLLHVRPFSGVSPLGFSIHRARFQPHIYLWRRPTPTMASADSCLITNSVSTVCAPVARRTLDAQPDRKTSAVLNVMGYASNNQYIQL